MYTFSVFRETLRKIFPNNVQIIDGGYGVANRLQDVLEKNNEIGNNKLKIEFYYSGRKVEETEIEKLKKLLKKI